MGTTLQHGIFLPAEGERNCYTGLESNWRAIDGYIGGYNVHVEDVVIHVSQADRDKWDAVDNKADASALTAHTGNTTIHVTAEDKAKWDAVTSKADDSDVVHKSGNETISGNKTFSSINGIEPSSLGMPSERSARIDISSYITNLNNGGINNYTVPANGYIFLNLLNAFAVICYSIDGTNNVNYAQSYFRQVDGQIYILFPVRKNDTFRTLWTSNGGTITVTGAYFIPCQGNV